MTAVDHMAYIVPNECICNFDRFYEHIFTNIPKDFLCCKFVVHWLYVCVGVPSNSFQKISA